MRDPLSHLPGYVLRRAANVAIRDFARRLATIGIRPIECTILMQLKHQPSMTASQLGKLLDIERTNMTPLLSRLEEAGLIQRTPIDRKSVGISLTTHGSARACEVEHISAEYEDELLLRVPEALRDHVVPVLNALWLGEICKTNEVELSC